MTIEYLRQSIFFFRSNFYNICQIQLPFLVALNVFFLFTSVTDIENTAALLKAQFTQSVIGMLIMPIYWAATIFYMQSTVSGKPFTASQCINAGLKKWPVLFVVFFLSSLGIFTGLMFLILPGIYVAIRLSIADYICTLEDVSAWQSVKKSWNQTAEYMMPLFLGIVLIFVTLSALHFTALSLLHSSGFDSPILTLPLDIFFNLMHCLIMIYGFRIYCLIKETQR